MHHKNIGTILVIIIYTWYPVAAFSHIHTTPTPDTNTKAKSRSCKRQQKQHRLYQIYIKHGLGWFSEPVSSRTRGGGEGRGKEREGGRNGKKGGKGCSFNLVPSYRTVNKQLGNRQSTRRMDDRISTPRHNRTSHDPTPPATICCASAPAAGTTDAVFSPAGCCYCCCHHHHRRYYLTPFVFVFMSSLPPVYVIYMYSRLGWCRLATTL